MPARSAKERRLDWKDIRERAAVFAEYFRDASKEASLKQGFWIRFFELFGMDALKLGEFEHHVTKLGDARGEIDYFWPGKLVVEHKSAGKNLDDALEQACGYLPNLGKTDYPRYIIVSDFRTIRLYDLKEKKELETRLKDLPENIDMFGFIAGYDGRRIEGQHPVNVKAAERMGRLYDMLRDGGYPREDLDLLLVRLVFCLFAENAEIFERGSFSETVGAYTCEDGSDAGPLIDSIFGVLNTKEDKRQAGTPECLERFPYVNGGLFSRRIETPMFDRRMRDALLDAGRLDWKRISPAIFGSLFQSIMDPAKRRELGAHYTSEENIMRAIGPLFMDGLRAELESAKGLKRTSARRERLIALLEKMKGIRVLDPACGCGNFLIVAYREMRRLEMDVMEEFGRDTKRMTKDGPQLYFENVSQLFIDHYYGVEIGGFASTVAKLSMILMDHLMNLESRNRFGYSRDIIPLKEKANIVCADSLELDWRTVVEPKDLTYIVGNPPFAGAKLQSPEQRAQMARLFARNGGTLDYVAAWYAKAADYMAENKSIRAAFVSTNSITQGEQVEPLWRPLFREGIGIRFAWRTFRWNNEAKGVAAVHVVIVGFGYGECEDPRIYFTKEDGSLERERVDHINPFLADGPDVFLLDRKKPICDVPEIGIGNKPIDDGNYLFTPEEKADFVGAEPESEKCFRRWIGSKEFINGTERYCLWLGDCTPAELRSMPLCMKRVEAVREFRLRSSSPSTRKLADAPTRFHVENMPDTDYMVLPETSSENREYIPFGFEHPDVLCANSLRLMPSATLYHFGILSSRMHMAWTSRVCGRLEMRYRYSVGIVYNNFPWPECPGSRMKAVADAARAVLDARELYPGSSLADLYDPVSMPPKLRKAHRRLDRAVDEAYGGPFASDDARFLKLLEMYREISGERAGEDRVASPRIFGWRSWRLGNAGAGRIASRVSSKGSPRMAVASCDIAG